MSTLRATREAQFIYDMAPVYEERTGQLLFNNLRHEIAEVIRGTELDPFYKNMELEEIVDWYEKHIVFDNRGRMIRLISDGITLWEESTNGNGRS